MTGPVFLMFLMVVMQISVSFSLLTTKTYIGSSGSISYNPVNLQDFGDDDYILPYAGVGADYCLFQHDDISAWTRYGHIDNLLRWMPLFHTSRMMFTFPSSPTLPRSSTEHGQSVFYDYKWTQLLQLFEERGSKVIGGLQNNYDQQNYVGSPEMTAEWLNFAQKWQSSSLWQRINIGVALFSEPGGEEGMDNGQGIYNTWYSPEVTTRKECVEYFAWLTKEIHKIAPDLIVFFPLQQLNYWDQYELFADMDPTGIFEEPNVVFDFVHPYLFENSDVAFPSAFMDPDATVAIYENQYVIPWINKLAEYGRGGESLWVGETNAFFRSCVETDYHSPDMDLQKEFMTKMINVFVKYGISFNLITMLSWSPDYIPTNLGATVSPYNVHMDILEASNYGEVLY